MKQDLILCTGGGTGGHVFPGLAVAEALAERWDGSIGWIGSARGVERDIVRSFGLPFWSIPAGKLRRYISALNLLDALRVFAGLVASVALMIRLRPRLLFSKGGFVSVPPVIAAWLLRIPVFSHESDVDPGLATKINLRFSRTVFIPYESSRRYYPASLQSKLVVSGNPVRRRVLEGSAERGRRFCGFDGGRPVVLFSGGSQGAAQVNEIVAALLPDLTKLADVVHQRGNHPPPRPNDRHYVSFPFLIDEFPDILAAADLAVARAGAGTIWELATSSTPSVLVPLMYGSSRGDQIRNAEVFSTRGAAVSLIGADAAPEHVGNAITAILTDTTRLAGMQDATSSFDGAAAAPLIAKMLLKHAAKNTLKHAAGDKAPIPHGPLPSRDEER
jgi:UDP-N-acetylglucosamine--N-acetylmuramyl-(pentapeptide) pyrophosphoryl-undecaprenol N-acetylglucosamine transferase